MKHAPKYRNEALAFLQKKLDRYKKLIDLLKNVSMHEPTEHIPKSQSESGGAQSKNIFFIKQLSEVDVRLGIDVKNFR